MSNHSIDDETRYRLLKKIEANPAVSQRELAADLGMSLGKINYCLKALIDVGWVKVGNFARSKNKAGYTYVLTPTGLKQKAVLTINFLERKQRQFDLLKQEIEQIKREVEGK